MGRKKPIRPKGLAVRDYPGVSAARALFRAFARVVEVQKRQLRKAHGLSLAEFDMLAALGNTEGLRMGELAKAMITSPANVTRVAVAMEQRGLVERRRSAHSDREVVAILTPAGEAAFEEHFMKMVEFTETSMTAELSDEELGVLASLCNRLAT